MNCAAAVRNLRRTPAFTATVVLTLAIGDGANTALFSVIDRLLLRPLPYPQGEQLVMVYEPLPLLKVEHAVVSPANWLDWQRESRSFEALAAWGAIAMTLTGEGEPERLNGQNVSAEFFDLLGVRPSLGRTFTSDDDQPGAHRVVVLSDEFWRRRFGRQSKRRWKDDRTRCQCLRDCWRDAERLLCDKTSARVDASGIRQTFLFRSPLTAESPRRILGRFADVFTHCLQPKTGG